MSIRVTLDLQLKPEALPDALAEIHTILTATRAFDGCQGVDVLVALDDPAHILFVESWDSPEHYAAYTSWRATPEGASLLGSLLAQPPSAGRFSVASDV
jgi:heme oxygenase (mycobilin-producing)